MRSGPGIRARSERARDGLERRLLRRQVARAAAEESADPAALLREAEALIARARAAGALTWDEINAHGARELRVDAAAPTGRPAHGPAGPVR